MLAFSFLPHDSFRDIMAYTLLKISLKCMKVELILGVHALLLFNDDWLL